MSVLTINSSYDTLFPEEGVNHSSCAKHWTLAIQDISCADMMEKKITDSHPFVDLIAYWWANNTTDVYPIGWCHERRELVIFQATFVLNPPSRMNVPSSLVEIDSTFWCVRSVDKLVQLVQQVKGEIDYWGERAYIDSFICEFGDEVVGLMD